MNNNIKYNLSLTEYILSLSVKLSFFIFGVLLVKLVMFKDVRADGLTFFLVYFSSLISGTLTAKRINKNRIITLLVSGFFVAFFSYPMIMVAILISGFSNAMPPVFEMAKQIIFIGLTCSIFSLTSGYMFIIFGKFQKRRAT